ncbi:MAG: Rab family GTPase [Promethearchaeota archaeon]|jgi:small GTP-binding protein
MNDPQKFRFKISVIGDGQVGKTSLIRRFTQSEFEEDYIKTLGAQFSKYDKEIEGDETRLIFWDIAGQDDFLFLRPSFYKESSAAIIVFSLEKNELGKRSFDHIMNWYENIQKFCGSIPIILFANKVDLVEEDSLDNSRIQNIVDEQGFLGYYLTSAKTGEKVNEAFNAIITELYHKAKSLSTAQ